MLPKKKAAPVRPAYRPPRVPLTHTLVAEIVDLIEKGAFPLAAARAVGVPRRTWYEWLAAGDKGSTPETSALSHAIEKARGRLAVRYFATINDAALGHEEPLRDAKGNVVFHEVNGKPVPMMIRVPGQWVAAARALESLSPDEFLRQTGGSPKGGAGEGDAEGGGLPEFTIVYLNSDRDPQEMREIEKEIAERAGRA